MLDEPRRICSIHHRRKKKSTHGDAHAWLSSCVLSDILKSHGSISDAQISVDRRERPAIGYFGGHWAINAAFVDNLLFSVTPGVVRAAARRSETSYKGKP